MSAKSILFFVLLFGVAGMFIWERGALTKLRQQNESLHAERAGAERLAAENRGLPKLRAIAETAAGSPSERTELLRLRNEVHELRAKKGEVEKLRVENQRLAAEIKSGNFARRKLSEMQGYLGKETWANAGVATPEATVQTFFWAISTANFEQFVHCLTPEEARQLQQQSEQFRNQFFRERNPFGKLNSFRIAERTPVDENNMQLGIQAAAGGEILPLRLRRFGQEWKIEDF